MILNCFIPLLLSVASFDINNLTAIEKGVHAVEPIHFFMEITDTPDKRKWGLMQRGSLPNDYGMLFVNSLQNKMSLWSFNCLIDLDVAFMDGNGIIQEIARLKAYPEMMDPSRPVRNLNDLNKYRHNDPIRSFFLDRTVTSKMPCSYALETNTSFFDLHDIKIGDRLLWDGSSKEGIFVKDFR